MVLEYVDGTAAAQAAGAAQARQVPRRRGRHVRRVRASSGRSRRRTRRATRRRGAIAPVIHRDVNPSNVLIPWDGHVKIADFGIAKVTGVDNDKTQAGFIKGTYGYMAPEQVRGESVTDRADVYAAWLLLWELLVGRKAIVRGQRVGHRRAARDGRAGVPARSAALRPELPLEVLDAVGEGARARPEPARHHAEEIAAALRGACDLEQGRQQLVDTLATIRPPSIHDDAAVPLARTPDVVVVPAAPDSSADATHSEPDCAATDGGAARA